ncbi:alpha/beta-hydrolase [Ramicandelaber brevisporus]|nr:alpha/beta-hydrolase [Ramicandelaber brevisporus]
MVRSFLYGMIFTIVARNLLLLCGLGCTEPSGRRYSPSFFRAAYIMAAFDAGHWTAGEINNSVPKPVRDFAALLLSIIYMFAPDDAVTKIRQVITGPDMDVKRMRSNWEKRSDNSILRWIRDSKLPRLETVATINLEHYYQQQLRIEAPHLYSKNYETTELPTVRLLFNAPPEHLTRCTKLILHFHGGGFVAMNPRDHEPYLRTYAMSTDAVVVSINYAKAPEYPYPYAVNQVWDMYRLIMATRGACLGMNCEPQQQQQQQQQSTTISTTAAVTVPKTELRVVVTGDSAGANLAAGLVMRIIQYNQQQKQSSSKLVAPTAFLGIYGSYDRMPAQTLNPEHLLYFADSYDGRHDGLESCGVQTCSVNDLLRERVSHSHSLVNCKQQHRQLAIESATSLVATATTTPLLSSRSIFADDRVISAAYSQAYTSLYVIRGIHHPSLDTSYLLSPCFAPSDILVSFPPAYFVCGSADPFVDATIILCGRIKEAKLSASTAKNKNVTNRYEQFYRLSRLLDQEQSKSSAVVARRFRSLSVCLVTRSTRSFRRFVSRSLFRLKTAVQGVRHQAL